MLSEEEKKAIKYLEYMKNRLDFNKIGYVYAKEYIQTVLNLITKLEKEVEHQKEKRENQKTELAILNEKQKEMNKLKNTVSLYCGMFRKQEREIRKLQKENEEKDKTIEKYIKIYKEYDCYRWVKELEKKDKQITELIKYINKNNYVDSEECQFQYDFKIKKCIEKGNCEDCIKQYFEKLAKEKGE